jgi:transposase InsO family protein
MGGEPPFAAACTKVSYAQIVYFAKLYGRPIADTGHVVGRRVAASPKRTLAKNRRRLVSEQMSIPLIVLPPARPKYNGGVERGNRTFREEFYACRDLIADSIGAMRFELLKAVDKYNTFRPHHALKGKTPMEYLRITQAEAA